MIGFTVIERYPAMKVVVAPGKASRMQEVLEKMAASTGVIPLWHHYPVSTEPEEVWEHGNLKLGFDAEEPHILKLPRQFENMVVWGSRYPHHDTTSAWDALVGFNVPEPFIARMMGGNAARQLAIDGGMSCKPPAVALAARLTAKESNICQKQRRANHDHVNF